MITLLSNPFILMVDCLSTSVNDSLSSNTAILRLRSAIVPIATSLHLLAPAPNLVNIAAKIHSSRIICHHIIPIRFKGPKCFPLEVVAYNDVILITLVLFYEGSKLVSIL